MAWKKVDITAFDPNKTYYTKRTDIVDTTGDVKRTLGDYIVSVNKVWADKGDFTQIFANNATFRTVVADSIDAEKIVSKVVETDQFKAGTAEIVDAKIENLDVDKVVANSGAFEDLKAVTVSVGAFDAYKATIENLMATKANIEELEANYIKASQIEATYAKVSSLDAVVANIGTLNTDLANIEQLVADKADITDLNAANARIDTLNTDLIDTNKLLANKVEADYVQAEIIKASKTITDDLEAVHAVVDVLDTKYATIENLNATKANLETLIANKATIEELNAAKANIGELDALVANVNSILAGNIGTGLLQTIHLTAQNIVIDDAIIKSANIESLDVSKLNTGTISTDKFTIKSDDGGIQIVGSTQQFTDKNGKVRLQIGKDAKGEFNFIVFGEDGTTAIYDQDGITKQAVPDGLIVDQMIADDADIQANKIQYIDKDGNKTLQTHLNTEQGRIDSLIKETEIVKDDVSTLSDKYNETIETVEGTKTTVANIQSSVESMDARITEIKTTADGVSTTVTANKTKWDQASADANAANSNASAALGKVNNLEDRANSGEFNGADGKGVESSSVTYQASTSGTTTPTGIWETTIPTVDSGSYLWTKTAITYTDNTTTTSYSVAMMGVKGDKGDTGSQGVQGIQGIQGVQGEKGEKGEKGETGDAGADGQDGSDGKGISSIVNKYLASTSASGVTTSTSGWTETPQAIDSIKRYNWHYQIINYTTGSPTTTTPAIIGVYGATGAKGDTGEAGADGQDGAKGDTGATGKGVKSVTPQYYLSTSNTSQVGGSWKTTQDAWSSGKYYWTRDHIVWTDNTTTDTTPMLAVGLNNANSVATNAQTIANQTADKFQWIVKSGSSSTDFTLTDRTAQLVADNINLKGLVTFEGLNSDTQDKINNSNDIIEAWTSDTIVDDITTINGGYISTKTIEARTIDVDSLFTDEAFIGNLNATSIDVNRLVGDYIDVGLLNLKNLIVTDNFGKETLHITNDGDITLRGTIESSNYKNESSGWSIRNDGNAEFNDVTVRGNLITSDSGLATSFGKGENLIKNSKPTSTDNWAISTSNDTHCVVMDGNNSYLFVRGSASNTSRVNIYQNISYAFSGGEFETYTLSFWYNMDANVDSCGAKIRIVDGNSSNNDYDFISDFICDGTWHYYSGTFDASGLNDVGYKSADLFLFSKTGVSRYREIKLEKGDESTSWSPNVNESFKEVRIWAGASFKDREMAPWIVYNDGTMKATSGEFGGVFTGEIKIGNVQIKDPSEDQGGDANITIKNGDTGVNAVNLTDGNSSSFAQNIYIVDKRQTSLPATISLLENGVVKADDFISVGVNDKAKLSSDAKLTLGEHIIDGSLTNKLKINSSELEIINNMSVNGETTFNGNVTILSPTKIGNCFSITPVANGIDIEWIRD